MSLFAALSALLLITSATLAIPLGNKQSNPGDVVNTPSSPLSLRTSMRFNATHGSRAFIEHDHRRLRAMFEGRGSVISPDPNFQTVPTEHQGSLFIADIGVDTPPTTYTVIVDTGSSNTAVGTGNQPFTQTSSSRDTGHSVQVSYGSGNFDGEEFTDTVTLGGVSVNAQSIAVARSSSGFNGLDGILGLGPDDLTQGTVEGENTIPTVTDNLASQHKIPSALVGVFFPPTGASSSGSLDFGVPDSSKYTGGLSYVPITRNGPSAAFWGIDQSITYGDSTEISGTISGIVDTGTTLFYLASGPFQAYVRATGAVQDQNAGLLRVADASTLRSLFFTIGGRRFEFTANAQIWPRSLNTAIGGDSSATYLVIQDGSSTLQPGMSFVAGIPFLQRFYSVFDTTNSRIGFATTSFTESTSN